jgi:hypothetical protein
MKIRQVLISDGVAEKIYEKHRVLPEDAEEVLFSNPVIRRAKDGRYIAIGFVDHYLTVIFEYSQGVAEIVTAYPSSNWQTRLYKRSKRKRR